MATIAERTRVCLRCGHEWLKRKETSPVVCPRCKSAYWNRPRQGIEAEGGD